MTDREKVIKDLHDIAGFIAGRVGIEQARNFLRTIDDTVALLKEQEAVEWINVKDRIPKKNGQYLVVYKYFDYRSIGVVRFSMNLNKVDKYIFNTEKRPGWYEPDDEVGYFERTGITHWAELPELPTD